MKSELETSRKRLSDLDVKLRRVYEDNLSGKLPDHIFSMFITVYDAEKAALRESIKDLEKRIDASAAARASMGRRSI